VATGTDFKSAVMASLSAGGKTRMPRRGEALLIGQPAAGGLIRMLVPRRYRWIDAWMTRNFVRSKAIDRLAIAVLDELSDHQSGYQMVISAREDGHHGPTSTHPRLDRLAAAARQEWA